MTTEAETGVMWPQAEEHLGPPASGRVKEGLALAEGAWPCRHLDVRLLASRAVGVEISVVLSSPVCGICLVCPRKLICFCLLCPFLPRSPPS